MLVSWTALVLALSATAPPPTAAILVRQEAEPAAAQSAAQAEFDELDAAYNEASRAWSAAYREARANEDKEKMDALVEARPQAEFLPRFLEGAKKHVGQEGAVPYLLWIVRNGFSDTKATAEATEALLKSHLASAELGVLAQMLPRSGAFEDPRKIEIFTLLIDKSPHDAVKAQALMARAEMVAKEDTDEARAKAKADYKRVMELSDDERLTARAAGTIFELEHLQVGMVAPEIEGNDLDGVPFKLSDYRGKVVLLDFWGDW